MNKKFFILTLTTTIIPYLSDKPISRTMIGEIELSELGIEKSELTAEEKHEVYSFLFSKFVDEINRGLSFKVPSDNFVTIFYSLT